MRVHSGDPRTSCPAMFFGFATSKHNLRMCLGCFSALLEWSLLQVGVLLVIALLFNAGVASWSFHQFVAIGVCAIMCTFAVFASIVQNVCLYCLC